MSKQTDNEVRALYREAEMFLRVGRVERVAAINEQLVMRGAAPVQVPSEPVRRKAVSGAAAARRKGRSSG